MNPIARMNRLVIGSEVAMIPLIQYNVLVNKRFLVCYNESDLLDRKDESTRHLRSESIPLTGYGSVTAPDTYGT